ncbi:MAG: DUF1189 domain-containing protein [Candidatus Moranbacteria bacterium]|nr:DUF1189 domain-containing protein [Candidatus Moranbacteria bacterium]
MKLLKRFVQVFDPRFIKKFEPAKEAKLSWDFWFTSNTLVVIIEVIILSIIIVPMIFLGKKALVEETQNFDWSIEVKDGELTASPDKLNKPYLIETENNTVIIIDLKNQKYSPDDLKNYTQGVYVGQTKIVTKDNQKKQEISYMAIGNLQINNQTIIQLIEKYQGLINLAAIIIPVLIGICLFIIYIGLRLIFVLFWALILMLLGYIFKIKKLNFNASFLIILNLIFAPFILGKIFGLLGVNSIVLMLFLFIAWLIIQCLMVISENKDQPTETLPAKPNNS